MTIDNPKRCERRYDDWVPRNSQAKLPEDVVAKLLELIRQDDVQSVSCPYDEPDLWLSLIAEQVKRAAASGLPPQDARRAGTDRIARKSLHTAYTSQEKRFCHSG